MSRIYNKKLMQCYRRDLRFNQTAGEKVLWSGIRKQQIEETRFLRQYSVNNFSIDFYSPVIKLGIEVDGSSHKGKEEYDKQREEYLESLGIKINRFTDEHVLGITNKIIERITEEVRIRKLNRH